MAYGFPRNLESRYNVLTVPNYVKDLVVAASPGTIHAAYTAPPGVEAWTVFRPSSEGVPQTPFKGKRVVTPLAEDAETTVAVSLTAGVVNGTEYVVRVFIRGELGFQTRVGGAVARVTPRAGQPISALPVGTIVKLIEGGTPTDYIIVHQGLPSGIYDVSCDGTWLLRKDIYEMRQWHSSNVNDYANSTLEAYLGSTFLARFESSIQVAIKKVKIPYRPGSGTSGTVNSGANGLSCKVFPLSGYEVGWTTSTDSYFPVDGAKLSYFENGNGTSAKNKRISKLNGSTEDWGLRSPHRNSSNMFWIVQYDGANQYTRSDLSCGVRPACVVSPDMLFHTTPNADGSYSPIL